MMLSNGTEIFGISMNETNEDVQALAPISRIKSAISIDYDAGTLNSAIYKMYLDQLFVDFYLLVLYVLNFSFKFSSNIPKF